MALVVPYVISSPKWKIEADVSLGRVNRRVYRLELANYPNLLTYGVDEEKFDSSVEERFFKEFSSAVKDWKITREPEPLSVSGRLYVPDFLLTKGELKVYVEIVGFWTREYLRRKLEKLRGVKEKFLVLVDRELSYEDFSDINVIQFKKKVDVGIVYKWLREVEASSPVREVEFTLTGDVVPLEDIAKRVGSTVEALRRSSRQVEGYFKAGDYYVSERVLDRLKGSELEGRKLSELSKLYEEIAPILPFLLERLGYRLRWLNVTDAVVLREGSKGS